MNEEVEDMYKTKEIKRLVRILLGVEGIFVFVKRKEEGK